MTAGQLQVAANDPATASITLTPGTYTLGGAVYLDGDHCATPLRITAQPGVLIKGSGNATAFGQIFLGLNSPSKCVTIDGFAFDSYLLAQAGIFEVRQTDHDSIYNTTITGITRDSTGAAGGTPSDKPYKTWGMYISKANTNLMVDGFTATGVNRDWSGIQIDSGTSGANITLRNVTGNHLDYGFYENVPVQDLALFGWNLSDTGEGGNAVSFHQATGTYYGIALSNGSGVVAANSSGMHAPTVSGSITVTQNNTTIDGVAISLPLPVQGTPYPYANAGVIASGTTSAPITNLTIKNCVISGGRLGLSLSNIKNLTVQNCWFSDQDYCGVCLFSADTGLIANDTVQRIGYVKDGNNAATFQGNNAYGIAVSLNAQQVPASNAITVTQNLVTDVPLWQCINSHAGTNLIVSYNTTMRCPRAIFMAGYDPTTLPVANAQVFGNSMTQAITKASAGGSTDIESVLYAYWKGGSIINNQIGTSYPLPNDYLGQSTGVTISGNVRVGT